LSYRRINLMAVARHVLQPPLPAEGIETLSPVALAEPLMRPLFPVAAASPRRGD